MKDGTTHLAYKPEHGVDLDTGAMLAASVYPADKGDTEVLGEPLTTIQNNLSILGEESSELLCVVTDKGYHKADLLKQIHQKHGLTTYIPKRKSNKKRKWRGNTEARRLFHANCRRTKGREGKRLGRLRSELVKRSFALLKQSGNLARMTIRGLAKVNKRYLGHATAYNLALVMRAIFGHGTPRGLADALKNIFHQIYGLLTTIWGLICSCLYPGRQFVPTLGSPCML